MSDDLVVYEENEDNDAAEFDMLIEVEIQKCVDECVDAIKATQDSDPVIIITPKDD